MKPTGIIAALMILLVSLTAHAQPGADTGRINALNRQAWKLRNNNVDSAKLLAVQALAAAQKINYARGVAISYNVIGHYHKVKGSYNTAFYYYQKSLSLRLQLHDTVGIISSYRNIVSIYKARSENKKAIDTATMVLKTLLATTTDKKLLREKALFQTNLADIYVITGDYNNAIQNLLNAQATFKKQDDTEGLSAVCLNLSHVYEELKKYPEAKKELEQAIKINTETDNQRELAKAYNGLGDLYFAMVQIEDALANYRKGLAIRVANGYESDIAGSLYNIGLVYKAYGKNDSALAYFKQSLVLSEADENVEGQYEAHSGMGSMYSNKKEFRSAISHFQKSLALSSKSQSLPEVMSIVEELSGAYANLGRNDSALVYSVRYAHLSDSLNEILRKATAVEAEIKVKDADLKVAALEGKAKDSENRSQKYIILSLFSIIALLGTILFMFSRSYSTKRKMLQLQDLIKEQELRALDAMIEGQESERKRLATELHDTIGSILSAIKFAFKSMENLLSRIQYQKINVMLDEALQTVRRISHDMASGVLLERGIGDALEQLCEMLQETGKIQIRLDLYGFGEKTESLIELNLYRIIQELLTNILRHSQAQNVSIQLIRNKDHINLVIIDDGKGFNPKATQLRHGIGLLNVDKRVENLSGKWDIDSGKGNGTTIVIDIPLNDSNT